MENNEVKFARILEEVKYTARSQGGFISKQDVVEAFDEMNLSETQFDMVFDYLKTNKIGLDEPLSDNDMLTEEERDILKEYKNEISELETLSEGEKRAFVMAAMDNDRVAQEKLIGYYLPKVLETAKLYATQGTPLEDLIGEGNLAVAEGVTMLGAMEEPEEADGMIMKMIMDAMERVIAEDFEENSKDEAIAEKVNKVFEKAKELSEELGRKVSVDELAENTKLSKKSIVEAIKLTGNKIEEIEYTEE